MKQSELSKILKLAKRSIEEYQNWDEDEIYKEPVAKRAQEKLPAKNATAEHLYGKEIRFRRKNLKL